MLILYPTQFISVVIAISLIVSFIYILLAKRGVWEYLQIHADAWLESIIHKKSEVLYEAFSCVFCLSWWMSILICIFFLVITGDFSFLLVPFCSTPLSRRII